MRLRTFESFWLVKNGLMYSYPSLQSSLRTQVLVVGGGITGALVSHSLMESGYEVTLIDRRDIAMGSTAATTSMLQYEIDVPLYRLSEQIGEEAAASCYRAGVDAIQSLEHLVRGLGLACGFERKNSLYIAHSQKSAAWLQREFQIRAKHGLGVRWLEAQEVREKYGLQSHGAILSDTAGSVDAYSLAHQLIDHNVNRGMRVYDHVEMTDLDTSGAHATVTLENGQTIIADRVVCCSGFESTKLLQEKVADLFHTYVSISEQGIELPEALHHTLVWNTDDPYLYLRTTDDGRLLVGGEDSSFRFPFFQQQIKERKADKLRDQLNETLPGIEFIEDFTWGGTFGSTQDGLPYIGQSPEYQHTYFVLGFGGNGITFSVQAMDMVQAWMKGETHPLDHFYRFGR